MPAKGFIGKACAYQFDDGRRCSAPALGSAELCRHHQPLPSEPCAEETEDFDIADEGVTPPKRSAISLPSSLDNHWNIGDALISIVRGIRDGSLEPKQATAMLYALQIAAFNNRQRR